MSVGNDVRTGRRHAETLGTDFLLPPETIAVRREARAFAEDVLRPIAHELNCTPERRDGFRHDVFQAIARAGLFAIPFAEDVGDGDSSIPPSGRWLWWRNWATTPQASPPRCTMRMLFWLARRWTRQAVHSEPGSSRL